MSELLIAGFECGGSGILSHCENADCTQEAGGTLEKI